MSEHPLVPTSKEISAAIEEVAKRLQHEGCKVARKASEVPDMKDLSRTFSALLMSMMGVDMPEKDYEAAAEHVEGSHGSQREQSLTMSYRDWMLLDRHRLMLVRCGRKPPSIGMWYFARRPPSPRSLTISAQ